MIPMPVRVAWLLIPTLVSALGVCAEPTTKVKLTIPPKIAALYLVPTNQPPFDLNKAIEAAVNALPSSVSKTAALSSLKHKTLTTRILDRSVLADIPLDLFESLGASASLVDTATSSKKFIELRVSGNPGWPITQDLAARAAACALAKSLHTCVIDESFPNIFEADKLSKMAPAEVSMKDFGDWVSVLASPYKHGIYADTRGMCRVGLPEVQAREVPQNLTHIPIILKGLAWKIIKMYSAAQKNSGKILTTWDLPEDIELTKNDINEATPNSTASGGSVKVHIRYSAWSDKEPLLIHVIKPAGDKRSLSEYLVSIDNALFGAAPTQLTGRFADQAMADAMKKAQATLPSVRERFNKKQIPFDAQLLIKFGVKKGNQTEYLWAFVNSWSAPDEASCVSADDAVFDSNIKRGRPLTVKTDSMVDWALYQNGKQLEGGYTSKVLEQSSKSH